MCPHVPPPRRLWSVAGPLLLVAIASCAIVGRTARRPDLSRIQTIVVIYAENRSFDNLYGMFPGADGIADALADPARYTQRDLDGSIMPTLPPVWLPVNDASARVAPDPAFPRDLPNRPFRIDADAVNRPLSVPTRDLVHRFYRNKEQIDGGKNDRFAALSDAGGLAMGYYDGSVLPMWRWASEYTLADHFFMGAFGGSFLNHFWLVCACTPRFDAAPARLRTSLDADGRLLANAGSPRSALEGPVQFTEGALAPDGAVVDGLQPPYQPSGTPPAAGGDLDYANPSSPTILPPQDADTIGDVLTRKGIDWVWYADAWDAAVADGRRAPTLPRTVIYAQANGAPNFQTHHMPFNYFARFDPHRGAAERAAHLQDGEDFLRAIQRGTLPPVSFYKPQGTLNEHPGYTEVLSGDVHIAELVGRLQQSPQWSGMLIIVTYDENGGFWDHVAPPTGDAWGPGTRVPTIIISPFARRGYVDHTVYDTTSILKLITERFALAPLPGIRQQLGDLTNALDL
jgi:acid phosphatase